MTWLLAVEAFGAAAQQLAVTSLPEGIAVYVRHDGLRGCHADIHLRIQLDPESTISAGQAHRLVPRIGTAAAEQCPVAVAARLEVVRGDQPNTVINTVTALKVKDWLAEPSWGESPVMQLHPARVDWDTKCANRTSLLDRARQEPSTAPGWLRGAWDQAGDWVGSSLQWVGVTAAALSSGQWPGEFRARVADFEAAGASLCVLAQQELDHTGAALGSGRLDAAARYITNAKDLLTRVEAADQAANAYYQGAVDRAETHWEIVFNTSKTAFSVTLAVGTAGGSVAPSAAGYYALKYGLFNALEFAVDSTEMSLKDAAARRAQRLAVELLVDGLIGQLLPNDFSYERLMAKGELAKADAFLANASADLVQQLSAGVRPELLRQVAEEALAQATDAAVRAAIEQEILKHGAYFLASALEGGNETIRGIASNFGPDYLAKRGTPSLGNCVDKAFVVVRGQETCDFFLDDDGAIHHRGQKISEPILVTGSSSGHQIFAQSLFVHPPSPSGRYFFIQACEGVSSSPGLCWSQWSFDADNSALNRTFAGKYGPHPYISWGPDDQLAGLFYSDEGFSQVHIVNARTGNSWAFPDWGRAAGDASSLTIEKESLVWVDPTTFYVDARFCTALKPSQRCYDPEWLSAIPTDRVLFRLQADGVNPVVTATNSSETSDERLTPEGIAKERGNRASGAKPLSINLQTGFLDRDDAAAEIAKSFPVPIVKDLTLWQQPLGASRAILIKKGDAWDFQPRDAQLIEAARNWLEPLKLAGFIEVEEKFSTGQLGSTPLASVSFKITPTAKMREYISAQDHSKASIVFGKIDFVKITGIRRPSDNLQVVEYQVAPEFNRLAVFAQEQNRLSFNFFVSPSDKELSFRTANFVQYDDGWRLQ